MKCSDARFALAANPGDDAAALAAHLDTCAACAAYGVEMRELDRRLLKTMQVGVPRDGRTVERTVTADPTPAPGAAATTVVPLPAAERKATPGSRRPRLFASPRSALAASVAAAAVLLAALWTAFPRETLASAVVEHMTHEPEAWDTTAPIPASAVAYALGRTGVRLGDGLSDVTYANTCWFRGRGVPHLVVHSPTGPVTIMVLPHETVARRTPFAEGGYRGVLLPAPRGSIAVLARNAADVDAIATRAAAAIRYVD